MKDELEDLAARIASLSPEQKKALAERATAELDAHMAVARAREQQAEGIADKMIACLDGLDLRDREIEYMLHMVLPRVLGRKLLPIFAYEGDDIRSVLVEGMMDGYMEHHICPKVVEDLNTLWEKQLEKKDYYGDIDFSCEKYLDNETTRVTILEDHVTCSDNSMFIVIEEKKSSATHIRIIVPEEESDYPAADFPQKLSLQFYEDKDFNMDDGNTGDTGYVLSFSTGEFAFEKLKDCLYFQKDINHVCRWLLGSVANMLRMGPDAD